MQECVWNFNITNVHRLTWLGLVKDVRLSHKVIIYDSNSNRN